MAHFALVKDNEVINVVKAELDWIEAQPLLDGCYYVQTSYNTRGNVHYGPDGEPDGGVALRGNYAKRGHIYDQENDVFYDNPPYMSWTLSRETWEWVPPIPRPIELELDGSCIHRWNEDNQKWDKFIFDEVTNREKLVE